jgi:hypothetical protein
VRGADETSWSDEDETVDEVGEVGGEVCSEGATKGIADDAEGGPVEG